jgi:ubiquinol-cytochrome c reductase cytochrome b/c1 subunit
MFGLVMTLVQKMKLVLINKNKIRESTKNNKKIVELKVATRENSNIISDTINNHLRIYPTPINITYTWSFGSLVGIVFVIQILTGIFLAMHYTPHVDLAFESIEHIMSDVNYGYIFRNAHANGASLIFILIYLHLGRGLYYLSYLKKPKLWWTGLIIFLLMMATAFIGYVLPWGQMSFWGATVITSLVTAIPLIGDDIAYWIWGGFAINNATLNRFFSIHYLLPFIVTGIISTHLVFLHTTGSNMPLPTNNSSDKITFHPYFTYKDTFVCSILLIFFITFVYYYPNILGHADNFINANALSTPAHIVPEWYFTPFYAILRSCPDKIGGAIGMIAAILIFFILPFYNNMFGYMKHLSTIQTAAYRVWFWLFVFIFFMLMLLGSNPAAAPFIILSRFFTFWYFFHFLIFLPIIIIVGG